MITAAAIQYRLQGAQLSAVLVLQGCAVEENRVGAGIGITVAAS